MSAAAAASRLVYRRRGSHAGASAGEPPGAPAEALADLAAKYGVPLGELDGWAIATHITRSGAQLLDRGLRAYAERLAAAAVLRRAAELVGPMRTATHPVSEVMREPHQGELDVERTLENVTGKQFPEAGDWVVTRRQERRQQVVLMMDTSLSMSGEKMALAAVATAVLALKMHGGDLAVVTFEDTARAISRLGVEEAPEQIVRLMLEQPVRGYTNIAAALELGAAELERGRNPRRAGLLITDGVYTVGQDPVPLAARFPRLFVLLTEDYKMDPDLCRRMADLGGGDVFPVKSFQELPRRMLEVANRVLR